MKLTIKKDETIIPTFKDLQIGICFVVNNRLYIKISKNGVLDCTDNYVFEWGDPNVKITQIVRIVEIIVEEI